MFLTYIETRLVAVKLAHTEDGIFDIKKNKSSNVYVCLREGPILIIERRSYYSHCVLIG